MDTFSCMPAQGPGDDDGAPAASPGKGNHPPGGRGDDRDAFPAFQEKVKGTNINPQTLLATDYLNHFNEIVMTLEMIPDIPDLLEDAKAWRPKTYQEHFQESSFADRELAIEAYEHVPARFRQPFELTTTTLDSLIAMTLERAEDALAAGEMERLKIIVSEASEAVRSLMDSASGIIHGTVRTMEQSEIDGLLRDDAPNATP